MRHPSKKCARKSGSSGKNSMNNVTELLNDVRLGKRNSDDLLPLLYEELRSLAASKMRHESPGITLQSTALVHEAYMRLVKSEADEWQNRAHFFGAAANAMRRILVEQARHRKRAKRGGDMTRQDLAAVEIASPGNVDVLDLNDALDKLAATNPEAAELVTLRFFSGFTNLEAARATGMSPRKATSVWAYARAWLLDEMGAPSDTRF